MDLRTSLLVNRQVPEYVREEYPLFISFLEAYYEFLEKEQFYSNSTSQKNNLIEEAKNIKNAFDLDESLERFEENFFNTFASLIPSESVFDKTFFMKNVLPLYRSKGTLKSFELLFRLLFQEEIKVEYPRNNILRASDGKWIIENILRTEPVVTSVYTANSITDVLYLPYELNENQVEVRFDGNLIEQYAFRKELKKIILLEDPSVYEKVEVRYLTNFNLDIFNNRQLVGQKSGAKALVENVGRRRIAGEDFFQFFIDEKTKVGNFINGEIIDCNVIVDDKIIPFSFQSLSEVQDIQIVRPGSNYNVGDSINFLGKSARKATGFVSEVSSGKIEQLFVKVDKTGQGYRAGSEIYANNYTTTQFKALISSVDDTSLSGPNFIRYNIDVIDEYASSNIDSSDYGFKDGETINLNSVISESLNLFTLDGLGPLLDIFILTSEIPNTPNTTFVIDDIVLYTNPITNDDVTIIDIGSIASIKINNGGQGYSVGDEILFVHKNHYFGRGARAEVNTVSSNGVITSVRVLDGGINYRKDFLPTIKVNSEGNGANLEVDLFMHEGAEFQYDVDDGIAGKILNIEIVDKGSGYESSPLPDLTTSGNGDAQLTSTISSSYISLPGKWTSADGLLSSDEMRIQGENYYIDFSYVITSKIEFNRYRKLANDLLNPTGFINYARYNFEDNVEVLTTESVYENVSKELAGTGSVNVTAGSYTITGTNTYFVLANTLGLIGEGTYIVVNSEIRIVNTIINNTTITVSEPFEFTSTNVGLTIYVPYPYYRGVVTEYWRELAATTQNNKPNVISTEDSNAY
jgi:hypothetical protein